MGFGRWMANSPMVIMWANPDGTVTLSQRTAPREIMPTVDPNPPRVATLSDALTSISNSTSSFGYMIQADGNTEPRVIYAYGTEVPSSSAVDALLVMHIEYGVMEFNLALDPSPSIPLSSSPTSTSSASSRPSSSPSHHAVNDIPLLRYQRYIIVHAVFCVIGFLILLPAGVLLARFLRTFTPAWFQGHWIVQFVIAGPFIALGSVFGVLTVSKTGAHHLNDQHKLWGAFLVVLYVTQLGLGAVIHWIKPKRGTGRRPQNYAHAIIGLLIMTTALYQVYLGFKIEWPKSTGRGPVPGIINVIFWGWALLLPGSYLFGMVFLPKQLRQEQWAREKVIINDDEIPLNSEMADIRESEYHESD